MRAIALQAASVEKLCITTDVVLELYVYYRLLNNLTVKASSVSFYCILLESSHVRHL